MFHHRDNLFFGRRSDGSVRIMKFSQPPKAWPRADAEYTADVFDAIVDGDSWCSVIASVSAAGEQGRWELSKSFHNDTA